MGCANSKQTQCKHCKRPFSPRSRSYSMPSVYRRFRRSHRRSDRSYHVITPARTSCDSAYRPSRCSTSMASDLIKTHSFSLRSSDLLVPNLNHYCCDHHVHIKRKSSNEFSSIIEATNEEFPKVMVSTPRTPTTTPPGEPETINTWELMEGLEDNSPIHRSNNDIIMDRCFSFRVVLADSGPPNHNKPPALEENHGSPSPKSKKMADYSVSNSNSIVSDFDPEIISTFRKALEQLSPRSAILLRSPESEKIASPITNRLLPKKENNQGLGGAKCLLNCENKVVIYFTSLRGVRKTYEDCCNVRVIMQGLGVRVDERDVSMHYGFREELKELLGSGFSNGGLPKVFAKGRYIGGAYEIKQINEEGELQKVLEGCEKENGEGCESCGDVRFMLCEKCSGSCKVYYEDGNGEGGGFVRCPHCNENGILRCPDCCG